MPNQHTPIKKYDHLKDEIISELESGASINGLANKIIAKHKLDCSNATMRAHIRKQKKKLSHPALQKSVKTQVFP